MEAGKIKYYVYVTTELGTVLNITQAIDGLGWEENENELSERISFSMYNAMYNKQKLSKLIKIGQNVVIKADWGSGQKKVAEGKIVEAEQNTSKMEDVYKITAYDILFNMQKSQDSIYFESGKTTNGAIGSIFSSWGVPVGKYTGPNVTHGKIIHKNKRLSDIILDILDDAKKKGGCKCVVRAEDNKACILKLGSNDEMYVFNGGNCIEARAKISIMNMVTRVKILATNSKEEEAPKVEAVVDGKTEYGILQRITTHSSSDTIEDAKAAAKEIIDENGDPEKTYTVQCPDVPPVRKGDKVQIKAGSLQGKYTVKSVQHNAATGKMSMQVEEFKDGGSSSDSGGSSSDFNVGDSVWFNGGKHYVASYSGSTGYGGIKPGPARIAHINLSGSHPYSLVTEDWSQTHVWGWVDAGTFEKR